MPPLFDIVMACSHDSSWKPKNSGDVPERYYIVATIAENISRERATRAAAEINEAGDWTPETWAIAQPSGR